MKLKDEFIQALIAEIRMRKDELRDKVETIYFGGGTPSLLNQGEIQDILERITEAYDVAHDAEITLEANPDDLSLEKLRALKQTPVNRLSVGVQSFRDEDLKYMNRAHNAAQAEYCIKAAQDKGFENLTIDLIYGTPSMPDQAWTHNLKSAVELSIPHISSYALTVENDTPLFHLIRKNEFPDVDEARMARHFEILSEILQAAGYEHYEISNFALPGFRSRHNSSYWEGKPYIGLGPSAHSFNGTDKRRWNIASNIRYIRGIQGEGNWFTGEILTVYNLYNEYIMTGLRKTEGIKFAIVQSRFGSDFLRHLIATLEQCDSQYYIRTEEGIILTLQGKLLADRIASTLFCLE